MKKTALPVLLFGIYLLLSVVVFLLVLKGELGKQETWRVLLAAGGLLVFALTGILFWRSISKKRKWKLASRK